MKKIYATLLGLVIAASTFAQCTDLFFSEYVEGSGSNKALELFNPTAAPVNLNGYKLFQYNNGATTPTYTFNLSGTVAAGDVYVIVYTSAVNDIKALADTVTGSSVVNFNGNDVLALVKGVDTLDRIGVIGMNGNIPFDTLSGQDRTYVRNPNVQQGTLDWSVGTLQWTAFPRDTVRLGSHSMVSCAAITDTLVRFSPNADATSESAGTYNVGLSLNAASASTTFSVDVQLTGGTGSAADINNYTTQTVTFTPSSASQVLALTITDDLLAEGAETLIFKLSNPTNGLKLGADSVFTLTIGASDVPVQTVTIAQIASQDTAFAPDSLGVKVAVSGTVTSINFRAGGLEFYIHDATDGVQVFSPSSSFGYTVTEGDSVFVQGQVGFFNGLLQINFLDTVYKIGTGTVPTAMVAQDLDESTESEVIKLLNVHLVTPAQWTGTGSGFSVDITDGVNNWVMRVDDQTDLFSTQAPTVSFDVTGIGSQFDPSSPYNSGYQIFPRRTTDLNLHTGISEVEAGTLKVFPNPNQGQFTLQLPTEVENVEICVFNIEGRRVWSSIANSAIHPMNLTGFTAGVYFIEAKSANSIHRNKIQIYR